MRVLASVILLGLPFLASGEVDFARDIQPILNRHCLACHGPEKQKADLRWDLRASILSKQVLLPGKASESPMFQRIQAPQESKERMPPTGPGLTQEERQSIEMWIESGAHWPDQAAGQDERLNHWAWQPLQSHPDLPSTLDGFIDRALEKKGLTRSPQADRRTLIRRLTFDLHGLPASREEIVRFEADPDPRAYEKLVDRLLASPRYGERMARHWLDIAHYADTHGFERDKRRDTAWRYRDWVIDAFNRDLPYDDFLTQQIAGDVLYPDNESANIATGFLAAGPWDFVGQVETKSPELRRAARALDLDDMATQVLTSTLGITINCARCHDHKLDPISQEEYYRMRAVFAGLKREERVTSPARMLAFEKEQKLLTARIHQLDQEIGNLEGKGLLLADIVGGGNGRGNGVPGQGLDVRTGKVQTRPFGNLGNVVPNHFTKVDFDFIDGVFVAQGEEGQARIPISSSGLTITGLPTTSGMAWDMIRNGPVASQHSPELDGVDFTKPEHSLLGLHANAGITFDLATMRQAANLGDLRLKAKLGYFGAAGAYRADVRIYLDGRLVLEHLHLNRAQGLQAIDLEIPESIRFLTLVATDGGNGYSHDQIGFGDAMLIPAAAMNESPREAARLSKLRQAREALERQRAQLGAPPRFYGVVADANVPEIRVQRRGDPEAEAGPPLAPGALQLLPMLSPELTPLEASDAERRQALARWITHPDNPLTPRVLANRVWLWHFGEGLVRTPSDFGLGGDRPSHPELLDWLALRFQQSGGSMKELHRLIVTSRTYQQSSSMAQDSRGSRLDAGNRLLWRQNPKRLEAEAIRDAVLATSGCLNLEAGGPGYEDFTYKEAYAPEYTHITADSPPLWRRGIYRYVVRTTPDPFLTTLDCPDPANMTPKRMTTTTPLQSLALFNNGFMLKQARYFADRVKQEAGTDPGRQVAHAFELALGRSPSTEELRLARELAAKQDLFSLCRALYNANEFLYVD